MTSIQALEFLTTYTPGFPSGTGFLQFLLIIVSVAFIIVAVITAFSEDIRRSVPVIMGIVALLLGSYGLSLTGAIDERSAELRAIADQACPLVLQDIANGSIRTLFNNDLLRIRSHCGAGPTLEALNSPEAVLVAETPRLRR